jgi:hypothetical protein
MLGKYFPWKLSSLLPVYVAIFLLLPPPLCPHAEDSFDTKDSGNCEAFIFQTHDNNIQWSHGKTIRARGGFVYDGRSRLRLGSRRGGTARTAKLPRLVPSTSTSSKLLRAKKLASRLSRIVDSSTWNNVAKFSREISCEYFFLVCRDALLANGMNHRTMAEH